jgi:alpha-1,6-mannosyltransferase
VKTPTKTTLFAALGLVSSLVALAFFINRTAFAPLLLVFAVAFACYFWIVKSLQSPKYKGEMPFYLLLAVAIRMIFVFSVPNFSDDFYRFIWDGRLLAQLGLNPFSQPPSYFIEQQIAPSVLTPALFGLLNSPHYFSVYPAVNQAIFGFAVWLFPKSIFGAMAVIKLSILAFEAGTLAILWRILPVIKRHFLFLYALNPLVIIELSNNMHFEAALIFFWLAAVFFLQKNGRQSASFLEKYFVFSAFLFSLSVASKMLSLIFLPFLVPLLGWKKGIVYGLWVGFFTGILFIPLINAFMYSNLSSSFGLYFSKFEFNASLFYLVNYPLSWYKGFHAIYLVVPWLTSLSVLGMAFLFLKATFLKPEKTPWGLPPAADFNLENYFRNSMWAICFYFWASPTVHPWYVSLPVFCSLFTHYRFAILWSATVVLSYSHYAFGAYKEFFPAIILEYCLVFGWLVFELWQNHSSKKVMASTTDLLRWR